MATALSIDGDPVLPLPRSDDEEDAVLSACFMDSGAVACARSLLKPVDFVGRGNADMFAAILAVDARGEAVDPITVADELHQRGKLDAAGGKLRLGWLTDAIPTAVNVEYHAGIVLRTSKARAMAERLERELVGLREGRRDPVVAATELSRAFVPLIASSARRQGFLDDEAIQQLPQPIFLVDGLLPAGGSAELHGAPGVGKSFLALAMAACVQTGHGFFGRPTRPGLVIYVAAEGSAGLGPRLRAWKEEHGITRPLGIRFRTAPVQLLNEMEVGRFIADIRALDEAPALIILDTLARCLVGGEENSAKDMGLAVAAIDRIREATGAAVLVIHHSRKDGETERGSTALRGAVDAMLAVKGEPGSLRLTCEKMKDAPEFAPVDFRLKPMGESCVAIGITTPWDRSSPDLSKNHRLALESLARDFLAEGALASEWEAASKVPRASFFRVRTDLVTWGYASIDKRGRGGRYTATDSGRRLLGITVSNGIAKVSETVGGSVSPMPRPLRAWNGETEGTSRGGA